LSAAVDKLCSRDEY